MIRGLMVINNQGQPVYRKVYTGLQGLALDQALNTILQIVVIEPQCLGYLANRVLAA